MRKNDIPFLLLSIALSFLFSSCRESRIDYNKGVYYSTNQKDWEYATTGRNNRTESAIPVDVTCISTNPIKLNEVYIGTNNGVYFSKNGGKEWEKLSTNFKEVFDIAFDLENEDQSVYIAGIENGKKPNVKRKTSKKNKWETVYESIVESISIRSIAISPKDKNVILLGTSAGEVLRSSDYGNTWRIVLRMKEKSSVRFLNFEERSPNIVWFFSPSKGFFLSRDAGVSFEEKKIKANNFQIKDIYHASSSKSTPGVYYLSGKDGLLVSKDFGENWEVVSTLAPEGSTPLYSVSVNPKNSKNILVGTFYGIMVSEDGGITWRSEVLKNVTKGAITSISYSEYDNKQITVIGLHSSLKKIF